MVTTVSALATASRALVAMATPDAAAAVFAASTRSKPATEWPALTRFAAIGAPMLPRPMKAIFDIFPPERHVSQTRDDCRARRLTTPSGLDDWPRGRGQFCALCCPEAD